MEVQLNPGDVNVCYSVRGGRVSAVRVTLRDGEVSYSQEEQTGCVVADYDAKFRLLAVEVLGLCPMTAIYRLLKDEPEAVKRLVSGAILTAYQLS